MGLKYNSVIVTIDIGIKPNDGKSLVYQHTLNDGKTDSKTSFIKTDGISDHLKPIV